MSFTANTTSTSTTKISSERDDHDHDHVCYKYKAMCYKVFHVCYNLNPKNPNPTKNKVIHVFSKINMKKLKTIGSF